MPARDTLSTMAVEWPTSLGMEPQAPPPSLFLSHGPPTMVLDELPVRRVLADLGECQPRPKAILCVSAHWIAPVPTVSLAAQPKTIHDFSGFDAALYELRYETPGHPTLARRTAELLRAAGFPCAEDATRGLDHGAWEPLMMMYPRADVPVFQLSLWHGATAAMHLAIGQALAPLRAEGVLIVGSGTAVHNLRQWRADQERVADWAQAFEDWLVEAVGGGDTDAIADYQARAPQARLAHPSDDHYLPLPVAMGAAGPRPRGRVLHRGFAYGSLSMAAFAFTPSREAIP